MARILGIETSCDETAAAVVEDGGRILSNIVLSQIPVHRLYGGVVPELASREHLRGIVPIVRQAMDAASLAWHDLDAIAVTHGPGLVGALLVGLTYAKAIAGASGIPLIGVNHLEGHLHAVLLEERRNERPDPPLPAIALVVSGGHTQLYRIERHDSVFSYATLGQTRDDAAGEAYDKVAKLLGLGYPGGPVIDRLAPFGDANAVAFGPIRLKGNQLDFSFSGIKTAVLRYVQTHNMAGSIATRRDALAAAAQPPALETVRAHCDQPTLDLVASFQAAVVADLVQRTLAAVDLSAQEGRPAQSVFLTGGVAANRALRARLTADAARSGVGVFAPAMALCTDNAAMIAAAAFPHFAQRDFSGPSLIAFAQLPLEAAGVAN
ncbi:MAG TPA: tRNA (adenosine(37)-N6)-threonylcarbamoyltransferase complex transferase subunit TsaD [Terriglobales bacterium]|nr:tRNA (adenosine(37)-N6)-threonylcarbamoyltransferase complex transferase subunit TsaD [Terriglobales bacterium]